MSGLKEKVIDYYKISNYMVCYKLMSGSEVSFRFEKVAFPHLIGLHKLVDIPLIQRYNDDQERMVSAKYILFERESDAYRQLCIKQNAYDKKYYVESFFYEKSDDYIKGQRLEKVVQMKVVEPDGKIYLEDVFV